MRRIVCIIGLMALLAAAAGCSMCAHPYDYCGPVWEQPCKNCDWGYRSGSILGGSNGAMIDVPPPEAPAPVAQTRLRPVAKPLSVSRPSPLPAVTEGQPSAVADSAPPAPLGKTTPAPAGTREGTTRILSTTDRKVGTGDPLPADASLPSGTVIRR